MWIEAPDENDGGFFYSVRPRSYTPPAFVMSDTRSSRSDALKYCRAEVHLREGGQNYDVMGWTKEQIIGDVLDHFEKHVHFLHAVR